MSNAQLLSQLVNQVTGRNRVINGACRVAQRGSIVCSTGVQGYGGPDRFFAINANSAGGQFTQSQGTITYGGIAVSAVVQTVNTAIASTTTTNYWGGISQAIEGFNCFDLLGQPATVSFIFNASRAGTFSFSLRDYTGGNSFVTTFNYATANTPQKISIAIPSIPTTLTTPNSTAGGMYLNIGSINTGGTYQTSSLGSWQTGNFFYAAGSLNWSVATNDFIAATSIKLEAGTKATPMEPRLYGEELLLCQRYYQQNSTNTTDLYGNATFSGNVTSGSTYYAMIKFSTRMRANPTITLSQNATSNFNLVAASYTGSGPAADGFTLQNNANGTGVGAFFYGWSANAEL